MPRARELRILDDVADEADRLQVRVARPGAGAAARPRGPAVRRPLHGVDRVGSRGAGRESPPRRRGNRGQRDAGRAHRARRHRALARGQGHAQDAWNTLRKFWIDTGFVLAIEEPTLGIMETDWAENRADMPSDFLQNTIGKIADVFMATYKRDKFRTRLEVGTEPGTVDIYVTHRGAEQVPTTYIDNKPGAPAGFVWAVMPPNPGLEAEMLGRVMVRFGTPAPPRRRRCRPRPPPRVPTVPRREGGEWRLPTGRRRRLRPRVAPRRTGPRPRRLHGGRPRPFQGLYFVRYADPEPTARRRKRASSTSSRSGRPTTRSPSSTGSSSRRPTRSSVVTVQDPNGAPDKARTGEKILALLRTS